MFPESGVHLSAVLDFFSSKKLGYNYDSVDGIAQDRTSRSH